MKLWNLLWLLLVTSPAWALRETQERPNPFDNKMHHKGFDFTFFDHTGTQLRSGLRNYGLRKLIAEEREEMAENHARQQLKDQIMTLLSTNERLDHISDQDSPLVNGNIIQFPDLMERLIARGIKVNVKNRYHQTPLYGAVLLGDLTCVALLLKAHADPNCICGDWYKKTPIEQAISSGYIDIVKKLLEFGAQANRINESKESVLMQACKNGTNPLNLSENRLAIIKELLHYGADLNHRDIENRQALDIAQKTMRHNSEGYLSSGQIVSLQQTIDFLEAEAKKPYACTICLDEHPSSSTTRLGCQHRFCNECLTKQFAMAWLDQTMRAYQSCPKSGCAYVLEEADIRAFSQNDKETLHKFDVIKLRLCLHQNPLLRLCPGKDCTFIYENAPEGLPQKIQCPQKECRMMFCSNCQVNHNPEVMSCIEAAQVMDMSKSEEEKSSDTWKNNNTKPCPLCSTLIEKNAGCQYVKCTHCQELFCYHCLQSFGKELTGHAGSLPHDHAWHQGEDI